VAGAIGPRPCEAPPTLWEGLFGTPHPLRDSAGTLQKAQRENFSSPPARNSARRLALLSSLPEPWSQYSPKQGSACGGGSRGCLTACVEVSKQPLHWTVRCLRLFLSQPQDLEMASSQYPFWGKPGAPFCAFIDSPLLARSESVGSRPCLVWEEGSASVAERGMLSLHSLPCPAGSLACSLPL